MTARKTKALLPVVPIFLQYNYRGCSSAPGLYNAEGDSVGALERFRAYVADSEGRIVVGEVFVQPYIPTFCGGLIAVHPETRHPGTRVDPSLFPTVHADHANAAAVMAAIQSANKKYGRYMASMFGPVDDDYRIGRFLDWASDAVGAYIPHITILDRLPISGIPEETVSGIGPRSAARGGERAYKVELEVGRRHRNPNSGNMCVSLNLLCSDKEEYVQGNEYCTATEKDIFAAYDSLSAEYDMLPKRARQRKSGEVRW